MKPRLLLLAIMADRFANLEESNLAFLLDQKNSENTKKAQKLLITYFENIERKKNWQSLISSKEDLVSVMRKFYAEVRKRNGKLCTKSSLVRIRLAFSSSSVHTRLISSKTLSFLEPMQFIKRKFQSLNERKSSLTTQTTNKQRWHKETVWKWIV